MILSRRIQAWFDQSNQHRFSEEKKKIKYTLKIEIAILISDIPLFFCVFFFSQSIHINSISFTKINS